MSLAMENNTVLNDTNEWTIVQQNDLLFRNRLPATVYTALLMVIGTPGNVLVLYVYFFKWRKSTSRMFILFLTGLDFVNCVTTLPVEIYIMRYSLMMDKPWLCKISRFSTYTFNSSSAAILVGIAVDRFKRICRPHGQQFTAEQSKRICIGCILIALFLTWPTLIFYGTRVIHFSSFHGKACLLQNTFDSSILPYIYFTVMMGGTIVIFTTLSVIYYFVGLQIYRHRRKRKKRNGERTMAKYLAVRCSNQKNKEPIHDSCTSQLKERNICQNENNDKERNSNQSDNNETELNPLDSDGQLKQNGDSLQCVNTQNEVQEECNDSSRRGTRKLEIVSKTKYFRSLFFRRDTAHCLHVKLQIGRSTLMLFLITLAYIISFLPFYTIAMIRQTNDNFLSHMTDAEKMAYHVIFRSYLLSSAINPIIYSFCNNQFRTFCFDVFRKRKVGRGSI